MKLWMAYVCLGWALAVFVLLALAGCYTDPPSYPTPNVTANNNSGTITIVTPTGAGSAGAGGDAISQPISSPPNNSTTTDTK